MKIYDVTDEAFRPYGRVVEGYPVEGLLEALSKTPVTDHVEYVPKDDTLHAAKDAEMVGEKLFGGMPFQFGWCNGHNTVLNCLEFHRDSEFNLGTDDFILLLAKQDEIIDGVLDTAKVKAFRAPKGALVEVYATTLHYAPCNAKAGEGFRVMVALPALTNTDYADHSAPNKIDQMLWARNKWLLAHQDAPEAAAGAVVALVGENTDIAKDI